jgi:hypothetical protein
VLRATDADPPTQGASVAGRDRGLVVAAATETAGALTPGRSADWTVGGDVAHTMDVLIANGLIQPMIVVMPEVNGFGLDQRDGGNGAIASIEGYDNPGDGGRAMLATDAEYAAHSPGAYVGTMAFEHAVPVFVGTAGKGDPSDRLSNEKMVAALNARGQEVEYRSVANGYHTWKTARELLPYALIFASDHLTVGTGIGAGST